MTTLCPHLPMYTSNLFLLVFSCSAKSSKLNSPSLLYQPGLDLEEAERERGGEDLLELDRDLDAGEAGGGGGGDVMIVAREMENGGAEDVEL